MTDIHLAIDSVTFAIDAFQASSPMLGEWPALLASEAGIIERWSGTLYNIMLVALGLGFVIFVHELGHFLAAKAFGVQCDKFYVGFDPPIKIGPIRLPSKLFHFQWGETEYGIGIIPLGGYVKMLGQDDDPRNAAAEAERSKDPNAPEGEAKLNPRSYAAKSVFARMVIISAGVVMNLISGVLMAAYAFQMGVPYDMAVLGTVLPGDPAWSAGLEPGDRMVRINKMKDDELSFRDMQQSVVFAGMRDAKKPLSLEFVRNNETLTKDVVGTVQHSDPDRGINILAMGFRSTLITQLAKTTTFSESIRKDPALASELPELKPADIIVGIDGQPLPISDYSKTPLSYELDKRLEPRARDTVTLQVLRLKDPQDIKNKPDLSAAEREPIDVVSKPLPMKSFGIRFQTGPVTAVQSGSIADKAEIRTGFKLIAWEGKPIEDSMGLLLNISAKRGQKTSVTFERVDGSKVDLEWTVPEQFPVTTTDGMLAPVGLELPGTGVVYSISNIVAGVAAGSRAEKSGLQAGDKIVQVRFNPESKEDVAYFNDVLSGGSSFKQSKQVDRSRSMQYWLTSVQLIKSGVPVELHFERSDKVNQCMVDVHVEKEWKWPDRGFYFTSLNKQHKVENVSDALSLGLYEIYRRGGNVLEFLELLVRGKLPFRAVGGPGTIAMEANDAASRGIAPLLMFLTLLSANLAIVNFLPIPALDGGHMVFLIAEAIRGKPADEEFEGKLRLVGVLGLLCLMISVIFNDVINISRFFGG